MSTGFVESLCAAARRAATAAPVRTLELAPAGVGLRVHLVGAALADELAGGLLTRPAPAPAAELWAFDTAGTGVGAPRPPWGRSDYRQRDEIEGWTTPPLLAAFDVRHATLSAADTAAGVGVWWTRDAAGMAPWEGGAPLRNLLRWMLAPHGAHLIHAAVVGVGDGGVLLAGASGAGKSTTALACLQAGLRFVADDYCVVRPGVPPTAHPVHALAKAGPESLALLRGMGGRARDARVDWRGKRRLPVADAVCDALPLRAVVIPRVAARTGAPVPAREQDALRAILVSMLFQLPGAAAGTLAALHRLLGALPIFTLDVGPDVDAIPAAVAAVLEEAACPATSR